MAGSTSKALSNWLCSKNSKNLFVKIVHAGGRVELHDRPVQASEIMSRNPRCYVAHPHVFRQPWATVSPETMLKLGEKYYVVPITTVRKLQRFALKHNSAAPQLQTNSSSRPNEECPVDQGNNVDPVSDYARKKGLFSVFKCFWFFRVHKTKRNGGVSRAETRKRRMRGSTKRLVSTKRNWQPSSESIAEE